MKNPESEVGSVALFSNSDSSMIIDAEEIRPRDIYRHLINIITPRPIAWVSTQSSSGIPNLAPYSFFSGVGSRPPSLLFCPANKRDGSPKDTLRNIEATGEFVVNTVSFELAQQMHESSADIDFETSEFDIVGLTAVPSSRIKAPRVKEARASIECELMQSLHLGTGPGASNVVIGRIVAIQIDDDVLDAEGWADAEKLDTIGRMGNAGYVRTNDAFDLGAREVNENRKGA
ncbi:MAG: flavin reductase family protein [Planctomycetaceae bacterium]